MKRILNIVLLAVFALATVACDKDNISTTFTQESANTMSLSGASALSYQLGLEESSATYQLDKVQINRANGDGDLTVNLVTSVTGNATVTVDPVTFANGQTQATTKMSVSGIELGETVTVKVSIPEANANPIEGSALSFTVTIKRAKPASWVPVQTKSIFKNGLVGCFSIDPDGQYAPYCLYPVQVEKRSDANVFRVKNVAKSENWPLQDAEDDMEGDSYMVIDATDPNNVTMERFCLQIDWGYGPIYAGTFDSYGYPDDPKGTYDIANGIIKFSRESLGNDMPDYGTTVWYGYETILYLDESKMGVDFNRDYSFEELGSTVTLMDMTRVRGNKTIYAAVPFDESKTDELIEKHGHVYAIPSYMAKDFDIYFAVNDKGVFTLPEEYESQELGVELLNGVDIYMNITKASSFDLKTGVLNLVYDLVTGDGVKIKTFTDKFYFADTEAKGADYAGSYINVADESEVEITDDASAEMLYVEGLTDSLSMMFKYNTFIGKDQNGNTFEGDLLFPGMQTGVFGDIFWGVYYPAAEKYYVLNADETFDLIRTVTGAVAVIPSEIAYELSLAITSAGINSKGSLVSPTEYDYSDMFMVPADAEEVSLSDLKANGNASMENDNSEPLITNAVVDGMKLVVKQKQASDGSRSISKANLAK